MTQSFGSSIIVHVKLDHDASQRHQLAGVLTLQHYAMSMYRYFSPMSHHLPEVFQDWPACSGRICLRCHERLTAGPAQLLASQVMVVMQQTGCALQPWVPIKRQDCCLWLLSVCDYITKWHSRLPVALNLCLKDSLPD